MDTESSLSSYHIFNTVAETGNISKAAKSLYISQPAISRAVSRLEKNLSVKLFVRGSRGVRLTEEGELLYAHTRTAFDSLRQGEESLRRVNTLGIGHLRIGASTTLCKYLLMPYLQRFVSAYPHIKITIQCQSTYETLALLEEGRIDIGLVGEPGSPHPLDFHPIGKLEDIFVATKTYLTNFEMRRAAAPPDSAEASSDAGPYDTLSILKDSNVMLLDEKNITRLYIEKYFTKNNIQTGQILEVSNMDLLIDFAKISLGVACVIKQFVEQELADGSLVELPLPSSIEQRNVGFAYQKTALQTGAAAKFMHFYEEGVLS